MCYDGSMFKSLIEKDLKRVVVKLGYKWAGDAVLCISENRTFGDYSSNIALQLSKKLSAISYQLSAESAKPIEIAEKIRREFGHPDYLEAIEVAGAGFINFFVKDEALVKVLEQKYKKSVGGKRVLVEYAQPNTHKAFHIGHLRGLVVGESIARLLEFAGDEVFRVTYGGDIGLHVAKCIWAISRLRENFEGVRKSSLRERAQFLGEAYAYGANAYEGDKSIRDEIDSLNKALYAKDNQVLALWQETKDWSVGYFETIYSTLGTKFDAMVWESQVEQKGAEIVSGNTGSVFVKDKGAVIFPGGKYGLHSRVFITGAGYPTYEGKEMGLAFKESELFPYDLALHIIGNEQTEFFNVVNKALGLVDPYFIDKRKLLPMGMVNLSSGKMSSRKGNIIAAQDLIDEVSKTVSSQFGGGDATAVKIAIASVKFFLLKHNLCTNIPFDIEKSISLSGDTGPYLMYTFSRIKSLLSKAQNVQLSMNNYQLEQEERDLLRQLEYFGMTVEKSAQGFEPNLLAEYLLSLAKSFNVFYQKYPVLGSKHESFRLRLSERVGDSLSLGLHLLGIETVDRM